MRQKSLLKFLHRFLEPIIIFTINKTRALVSDKDISRRFLIVPAMTSQEAPTREIRFRYLNFQFV